MSIDFMYAFMTFTEDICVSIHLSFINDTVFAIKYFQISLVCIFMKYLVFVGISIGQCRLKPP